MKKKSRLPLIIGGVVVFSLLCVGTVYAGRGMISRFSTAKTVTPFNTIIFLMP
jgi:hypothetical protein